MRRKNAVLGQSKEEQEILHVSLFFRESEKIYYSKPDHVILDQRNILEIPYYKWLLQPDGKWISYEVVGLGKALSTVDFNDLPFSLRNTLLCKHASYERTYVFPSQVPDIDKISID